MSTPYPMRLCGSLLLVLGVAGWLACSSTDAGAGGDVPATAGGLPGPPTAPDVQTYENRDADVAIAYPGDWVTRSNPRSVLSVGPKVASPADEPATPELNVAVPKLPFHIPGMIPLGEVERGYVDDVKKRHTDVRVVRSDAIPFDKANARRFVLSGRPNEGGPERLYDVLVVYRGSTDKLYVITSESPAPDAAVAHRVLDDVLASWRWLK
ncbi:MAG TPA: hypothetical protein VK324_00055 [Tepidisphaeraceae bacterium]|nr:hypothetical protein [Tepidisphaeraceae bacterium]